MSVLNMEGITSVVPTLMVKVVMSLKEIKFMAPGI